MALGAFAVSCSDTPQAPDGGTVTPAQGGTEQTPEATAGGVPGPDGPPASGTEPATPGVEQVRDAFATLQATLNDSCNTPGNCEYLLIRVHRELMELEEAMKAGPKGPGHFPEPLAWIDDLRAALDGDATYENLRKHQDLLMGTRDKINVWMQDHPDDYR